MCMSILTKFVPPYGTFCALTMTTCSGWNCLNQITILHLDDTFILALLKSSGSDNPVTFQLGDWKSSVWDSDGGQKWHCCQPFHWRAICQNGGQQFDTLRDGTQLFLWDPLYLLQGRVTVAQWVWEGQLFQRFSCYFKECSQKKLWFSERHT